MGIGALRFGTPERDLGFWGVWEFEGREVFGLGEMGLRGIRVLSEVVAMVRRGLGLGFWEAHDSILSAAVAAAVLKLRNGGDCIFSCGVRFLYLSRGFV